MRRRPWHHRVPDWVYYLLAAVITLLTIPIYRAMWSTRDLPVEQPLRSLAPFALQSKVTQSFSPYYQYGEALPAGYVCAGADGLVYRRRASAGAVVIEPLYQAGQLVHCGGDEQSSHRFR